VLSRLFTPHYALRIPHLAELDWIVMKSLEKDRSRRYESASALATDIQRYLSDEPVLACPPTTMYRFHKFARKHKPALATAAAIAACLILGTTVSAWQAVRATTAEAQANVNATEAQEKAQEANQQRNEAQQQRDHAQRQRDEVKALADKLAAKESLLQKTLYAAHINLAQQAWNTGSTERVLQLLNEHRPKSGTPDLRGFEWHYLNRLCRGNELELQGQSRAYRAVSFSPKHDLLATVWTDRTVRIWDVGSGKEIHALKGHAHSLAAVAFSPDGTRVVSTSFQWIPADQKPRGEIIVWDVANGRELARLNDTMGTTSVAVSPDNRRVAGSDSRFITIWELDSGRHNVAFDGVDRVANPRQYVAALTYSPDGKRLACGLANDNYVDEQGKRPSGTVKVFDADRGTILHTLIGHRLSVWSVAFSPDGKRLVSGSDDNILRVWDMDTRQQSLEMQGGTTYKVAYSPDGKRLVSGHRNKSLKMWDAETGRELATFKAYTGNLCAVALTNDGRCLAASSEGNRFTIKKWHASPADEQVTFPGHNVPAFSPDGKLIANSAPLAIWDVATGKQLLTFEADQGGISRVAFSHNGKMLATSAFDKTIKVWDTRSGRELTSKIHDRVAMGVAFSPDDKLLATSSWDGVIKLWETATWTEVRSLHEKGDQIYHVEFMPDGRRLASGNLNSAKIWDLEAGTATTLKAGPGECIGLAVSPDGKRVAGGCGNTTYVWNAESGELLVKLIGATDAVNRLAFSQDGKRIASSGYDTTTRLWDAETGHLLLTFEGGGVAFSPDGHRFAIGRAPGGVTRILDATPLPEKP
jgi:WD40 repeat protein